MGANSLDEAVAAFIGSLTQEQQSSILSVLPLYRVEPGFTWLNRIVCMFELTDQRSSLVADIDARYPNKKIWKCIESDGGQPVLEASIILRDESMATRCSVKA